MKIFEDYLLGLTIPSFSKTFLKENHRLSSFLIEFEGKIKKMQGDLKKFKGESLGFCFEMERERRREEMTKFRKIIILKHVKWVFIVVGHIAYLLSQAYSQSYSRIPKFKGFMRMIIEKQLVSQAC